MLLFRELRTGLNPLEIAACIPIDTYFWLSAIYLAKEMRHLNCILYYFMISGRAIPHFYWSCPWDMEENSIRYPPLKALVSKASPCVAGWHHHTWGPQTGEKNSFSCPTLLTSLQPRGNKVPQLMEVEDKHEALGNFVNITSFLIFYQPVWLFCVWGDVW